MGTWPAIHRRMASGSSAATDLVVVPGHALHEKGLQRQISDSPLVSGQERGYGRLGGAAIRGPAVEGAAKGYPGYPLLTRCGGSQFELAKEHFHPPPRETVLGFLWA